MGTVITKTGVRHVLVGPPREGASTGPEYWNSLRRKIVWCLPDPKYTDEIMGVCLYGEEYGMKFRRDIKDNVMPTAERATMAERLVAYAAERRNKKSARPALYH